MSLLQVAIPILRSIDHLSQTVFNSSTSPPVTAYFTFKSDGSTESNFFNTDLYCNPGVYTSQLWIKATLVSGSSPSTGTMNTWLALSTDRTWSNSVTVQNTTKTSTIQFDLATDSSGSNIISTANITITAQASSI